MGVRGLTTFIKENRHLLTKHRLHDCSLVIDGSSLCYMLYSEHRIDGYLGGDYNVFYGVLVNYFEVFRKCNIQLYVVLDGAHEDRKLNTLICRHKQKLSTIKNASRGMYGETVLPILAFEVLKHVLREKKIAHAYSDFEADDQIVSLANRLQCPVLSRDSDFYIYDVQQGYVEYCNLDLDVKLQEAEGSVKAYHYLQCRLYHIDRFLACFKNVSREVLPLFSALLGNDFVSRATFHKFLSNVRLPKKMDSQHSIVSTGKNLPVVGVLAWLQSVTPEEAITKVLGFVSAAEKERLKETMLHANQVYVCRDSLTAHLGLSSRTSEEALVSFGGHRLPEWFSGKFRSCLLPSFVINVAIFRRVFLTPQAGDNSLSCSSKCSLTIRQVIYGLILSVDQGACDGEDTLVVTEYGDDGRQMRVDRVEPSFHLSHSSSPLPPLHDLRAMSAKNRRNLLLEVLRIDNGEPFQFEIPSKWNLFCCVLIYWLHSTAAKVHFQFLNAVLLTALHVFLSMPSSKRGRKRNPIETPPEDQSCVPQSTCKEVFKMLEESKEERKSCQLRLSKHWHSPKIHGSRRYEVDVGALQWFSELQSCLQFSGYLNCLLDFPLDDFRPAHFLSGTLTYNWFQDLKGRSQPESYLTDALGASSLTYCFFLKFRDYVMGQVSKDRILFLNPLDPGTGIKRIRRKRGKGRRKCETTEISVEDESNKPNYCYDIEVDNMYSALQRLGLS